jgi:CelD/BcsL family acetyltransferase involved in cellulose biosynthesis
VRIKEIENYNDFIALKDRWNDLLQKCDNTIFSTFEWLSTWWKHFGKEKTLRILVAEERDAVVGIAPLMLSKDNLLYFGKFRRIEFIGGWDSDYNDFIFVGQDRDCLKFFLNRLLEFSDWDLLELREVNEKSSSAKALQAIGNSQAPKLEMGVSNLCPYITLPKSLKVFVSGLGSNMRKNLRRYMRKLRQEYKVGFKTQSDFSSTREAVETFFKLHQKRWESLGHLGAFVDKTSRDFHIEIAEIFDQKDWLALHFLTVNDEPIAAAYTFNHNLKKYARLTGFDPDFSRFRAGNLLKMHIIEDCIKKGLIEYDLSRGTGFGKEYWSSGVRKNFVAKMYNNNWRGKAFSFANTFLSNRNQKCKLANQQ